MEGIDGADARSDSDMNGEESEITGEGGGAEDEPVHEMEGIDGADARSDSDMNGERIPEGARATDPAVHQLSASDTTTRPSHSGLRAMSSETVPGEVVQAARAMLPSGARGTIASDERPVPLHIHSIPAHEMPHVRAIMAPLTSTTRLKVNYSSIEMGNTVWEMARCAYPDLYDLAIPNFLNGHRSYVGVRKNARVYEFVWSPPCVGVKLPFFTFRALREPLPDGSERFKERDGDELAFELRCYVDSQRSLYLEWIDTDYVDAAVVRDAKSGVLVAKGKDGTYSDAPVRAQTFAWSAGHPLIEGSPQVPCRLSEEEPVLSHVVESGDTRYYYTSREAAEDKEKPKLEVSINPSVLYFDVRTTVGDNPVGYGMTWTSSLEGGTEKAEEHGWDVPSGADTRLVVGAYYEIDNKAEVGEESVISAAYPDGSYSPSYMESLSLSTQEGVFYHTDEHMHASKTPRRTKSRHPRTSKQTEDGSYSVSGVEWKRCADIDRRAPPYLSHSMEILASSLPFKAHGVREAGERYHRRG